MRQRSSRCAATDAPLCTRATLAPPRCISPRHTHIPADHIEIPDEADPIYRISRSQVASVFFEDWAQAELERLRQRLRVSRRRATATKSDYDKAKWESMTEEERWWESQRQAGIFDS